MRRQAPRLEESERDPIKIADWLGASCGRGRMFFFSSFRPQTNGGGRHGGGTAETRLARRCGQRGKACGDKWGQRDARVGPRPKIRVAPLIRFRAAGCAEKGNRPKFAELIPLVGAISAYQIGDSRTRSGWPLTDASHCLGAGFQVSCTMCGTANKQTRQQKPNFSFRSSSRSP